MIKNIFIPAAAVMLLVIGLSGCSGSPGSVAKIYGNEWKLKTLNGNAVNLTGERYITITFNRANGNFNGFSGCNTYYGIYFAGKKNLRLSEISATEMMCDKMKTESEYLEALKKIDGYKITEGALSLTSFGNPVAIFTE